MKVRSVRRTLCVLATALFVSGPVVAGVGHEEPPSDPPDEYKYKFNGGTTLTGTVTQGGLTFTFNVTINSCGPSGNDCRRGPTGYEPR
jgi:hypothetical protein